MESGPGALQRKWQGLEGGTELRWATRVAKAVPPWEPQGLCLLLPGPSCHASHLSTANGTSEVTALPASLTPVLPPPQPPYWIEIPEQFPGP